MSGIVFSNENIGQISAEADENFLIPCFVDHESLALLKDKQSPKMVLLGPTGSGKTAILTMLAKNAQNSRAIQLDEVSLNYVANSDVVNFLNDLGVPLDHFFQAMWKHVLVSEYIKLRFSVDSAAKSQSFLRRLTDRLGIQSSRRKALDYLEKWHDRFWIEFDENVRELTRKLEDQVNAGFSAEVDRYKIDAGYIAKLSEDRKSNYQRRLKQFVEADLLSELGQVIQLLSDEAEGDGRVTFLIMDRLDENWISPGIKYHLIRALIEALKGMRRLRSLKVVVALRSDVMEKVVHDTRELGFQSEKYADYMVKLFWTSEQLKTLVDRRIGLQFRRKYTRDNVFFDDIFADKIDKEKTFTYMLDRTLMRPRDIISFVNFCLAQANGKTAVKRDDVRAAERLYSEDRRKALIDEWRSVFPAIEPTLSILRGRRAFFPLYELNTSDILNQAVSLFYSKNEYSSDLIIADIEAAGFSSPGDYSSLIVALFERLYLVGAVGLNPSPELPVQWFHKTQARMDRHSFGMETKVRIHPMLHSALSIRP